MNRNFESSLLQEAEKVDITTLPGYSELKEEIRIIEKLKDQPSDETVLKHYNSIPYELRLLATKKDSERYSINRPASTDEIELIECVEKSTPEIEINNQMRQYFQSLAQISMLYKREFGMTFFSNDGQIQTSITVGSRNEVYMPSSKSIKEIGSLHTHPSDLDTPDALSMSINKKGELDGDFTYFALKKHSFDFLLTDHGQLFLLNSVKDLDIRDWLYKVVLITKYLESPKKAIKDLESSNYLEIFRQHKKETIKLMSDQLSIIKTIAKLQKKYLDVLPEHLDNSTRIDDVLATLLRKRMYRTNVFLKDPLYQTSPTILDVNVAV
jgi:glycosyltransferase involved in cell wall biosynthesis